MHQSKGIDTMMAVLEAYQTRSLLRLSRNTFASLTGSECFAFYQLYIKMNEESYYQTLGNDYDCQNV